MIPRRGDVARDEHEVVSTDRLAPGGLDPVGVVPPSVGETLATIGADGPTGEFHNREGRIAY